MNILTEITNRLSIFKNLYDYARIIETEHFTILKHNDSISDNFHCLSESKRCSDCLAKKAFLTQTTLQKIELIDDKAYLHTLSPFSIENKSYVAEFFKDITETLYFNEYKINTPFTEFLNSLKDKAIKDPLTNAYNRNFLNDTLKNKFKEKSQSPVSIIMLDLDYFKDVNDKFGHLTGDIVLQKFSKLIFKFLGNTDYFCRFGGEEFLIFLDDAPLNKAVNLSHAIKEKLENTPFIIDNNKISISCSMGISSSFYNRSSLNNLLKTADEHMYIAKSSGRNTIIF